MRHDSCLSTTTAAHLLQSHVGYDWVMHQQNELCLIRMSHVFTSGSLRISHVPCLIGVMPHMRLIGVMSAGCCLLQSQIRYEFVEFQLPAIHRNTLQHTATHRNTSQHIGTSTTHTGCKQREEFVESQLPISIGIGGWQPRGAIFFADHVLYWPERQPTRRGCLQFARAVVVYTYLYVFRYRYIYYMNIYAFAYVYVCVYVDVCVCMYICIYVYISRYMCVYIYSSLRIIRLYTSIRTHHHSTRKLKALMYTYTHIHIQLYTCIYIYIHIYIHIIHVHLSEYK